MLWQARRDSNPQPPVLETGALAVELLAYTRFAPCLLLLGLPMKSMGTTEFTILLELKLVGSILLILGRRIVPPLTFCTSQGNNVSHVYPSSVDSVLTSNAIVVQDRN
jgi:hypothetical protein